MNNDENKKKDCDYILIIDNSMTDEKIEYWLQNNPVVGDMKLTFHQIKEGIHIHRNVLKNTENKIINSFIVRQFVNPKMNNNRKIIRYLIQVN